MRELLFRGKRIDNGEWIEGFLVICDERYFISNIPECDTSKYMLEGYWFGTFYEVSYRTLGQYIQMNDKNKKKIFVGDIFNHTTSTIDGEPICGKTSVDSMFNHALMMSMDCSDELEIIGNVFDNPELMKDGDKTENRS